MAADPTEFHVRSARECCVEIGVQPRRIADAAHDQRVRVQPHHIAGFGGGRSLKFAEYGNAPAFKRVGDCGSLAAAGLLTHLHTLFFLMMATRHLPNDEATRLERAKALGEAIPSGAG